MLPRPEHVLLHVPAASCMLVRRAPAFTQLPKTSLRVRSIDSISLKPFFTITGASITDRLLHRGGCGLFKVYFRKNTGIDNSVL